jgi:hypothetical protein
MGQDFKPIASTFTYQGAFTGGIQAVSAPSGAYYRASVDLPDGALATQVLFYLIVNDANPATVYFNSFNPSNAAFPTVLSKPCSTQLATIQTVDMGIAPQAINAVDLAWASTGSRALPARPTNS